MATRSASRSSPPGRRATAERGAASTPTARRPSRDRRASPGSRRCGPRSPSACDPTGGLLHGPAARRRRRRRRPQGHRGGHRGPPGGQGRRRGRGPRTDRTRTRAALAGESADLLYHALVLLAERGLPPSAVIDVLRGRSRRAVAPPRSGQLRRSTRRPDVFRPRAGSATAPADRGRDRGIEPATRSSLIEKPPWLRSPAGPRRSSRTSPAATATASGPAATSSASEGRSASSSSYMRPRATPSPDRRRRRTTASLTVIGALGVRASRGPGS